MSSSNIRIIDVLIVAVAVLMAAAVAFYVLRFALVGGESDPADTFVAHLRALDEGQLDDANALMNVTCGEVETVDVDAARTDLKRAGFTFQTAFRVGEVWQNEDGTEAILELETPPGLPLPSVQRMTKVDGRWLLLC